MKYWYGRRKVWSQVLETLDGLRKGRWWMTGSCGCSRWPSERGSRGAFGRSRRRGAGGSLGSGFLGRRKVRRRLRRMRRRAVGSQSWASGANPCWRQVPGGRATSMIWGHVVQRFEKEDKKPAKTKEDGHVSPKLILVAVRSNSQSLLGIQKNAPKIPKQSLGMPEPSNGTTSDIESRKRIQTPRSNAMCKVINTIVMIQSRKKLSETFTQYGSGRRPNDASQPVPWYMTFMTRCLQAVFEKEAVHAIPNLFLIPSQTANVDSFQPHSRRPLSLTFTWSAKTLSCLFLVGVVLSYVIALPGQQSDLEGWVGCDGSREDVGHFLPDT